MLHSRRITLIELSMPMELLLWALWFAAFDSIESSQSYSHGRFFSSFEWAIVFTAAGSFQFAALFYFRRLRIFAVGFNFLLWFSWCCIFVFSNYKSHAVPICLFAMYQNLLAAQRIRHDSQK